MVTLKLALQNFLIAEPGVIDRARFYGGVSSNAGLVRCRIIAPFCGNAVVMGRSLGPPGSGRVIMSAAQAGAMPFTAAAPEQV